MPTFDYTDKIIVIIQVNYNKNIHRERFVNFLLSQSAFPSAFAPSAPIQLLSKIIRIWMNNQQFIAIINKNRNFFWILRIII